MERLQQIRDLYKIFREQQPSSPGWYRVVDQCVSVLMENYIGELEERAPMVGLED